jgi:MFS superfamily sulfate permease-like transporter
MIFVSYHAIQAAFVFSVFGGQPLTIAGVTGVLSVFLVWTYA